MTELQDLLKTLISYPSISPIDAGCQQVMMDYLAKLGFKNYCFDNPPVSNFFSIYGTKAPLLVFAGHSDVVPPGAASSWETNPLELSEKEGMLYGRGVADMKGSLSAMLVMAKRLIEEFPDFPGSLGFLITSGEEGDAFNLGTPYVMQKLEELGIKIDYCIVGEPSSKHEVGDCLKIGRRGSLSAELLIKGKQGHVAYPHLAINPVHLVAPALADLAAMPWDSGNVHFPPTSLQITSIAAGGQAGNIIPGVLELKFNIRFSTEQSFDSLISKVKNIFNKHNLQPEISWLFNGEPFLTSKGKLLESCIQAVLDIKKKEPELSTSGGTSDGRFIAPYGIEVVELGPVNATIHQVNEAIAVGELETLTELYLKISKLIFMQPN